MSQAAEPAIAVDQLVKVYKTTRAVDGISFALERGSITGLLGGNGAGKTTTIPMIMGLVTPTAGTVKGLGADTPRHPHHARHNLNFATPYPAVPLHRHQGAVVAGLCGRVIIMQRGRIGDDGPPRRLLIRYGRETLEEVFLDVARGRGETREAAQ